MTARPLESLTPRHATSHCRTSDKRQATIDCRLWHAIPAIEESIKQTSLEHRLRARGLQAVLTIGQYDQDERDDSIWDTSTNMPPPFHPHHSKASFMRSRFAWLREVSRLLRSRFATLVTSLLIFSYSPCVTTSQCANTYRLAFLAFGTVVNIYSAIGGDSVSARVEAFGSGAWGCVSEPATVRLATSLIVRP